MRTRTPRLIVALLAGLLLLTGCSFDGAYDLPLPGGKVAKGDDSYEVKVEFTDALNVVPRTAVMVDDVPVGQVESVERKGWHAEVVIRVRKNIDLPQNAVAEVRQTSLLGEKYIALLKPETGTAVAARLSDGDTIPLTATGRNPEVEEVLGALSMVLSGGGVGQLKTIAVEMNKMMDGRADTIRHVLGQLDHLVGSLDDQKSDIIAAMDSIDRLTATLNKEKSTFQGALNAMGPALRTLNRQHRALVTMLGELDRLGEVGTRVLDKSRDDIVASVRHLKPIVTRLAEAGDALPQGLATMASFPFPEKAAAIAKGDYANALFKLDIDLNKFLKGQGLPDFAGLCYNIPLFSALCDIITGKSSTPAQTPPATGQTVVPPAQPATPQETPAPSTSGGLGGLLAPLTGQSTTPATPGATPAPSPLGGIFGFFGSLLGLGGAR